VPRLSRTGQAIASSQLQIDRKVLIIPTIANGFQHSHTREQLP
jgi:hypothetical protein